MNNNRIVDFVVSCMAIHGGDSSIQTIQTAHRLKLAQFWEIKEGDKILEIGCGQGDTTAVLAYLVGEQGFVHGVDIASPLYGAPLTLGEAAEHLEQSELGKRMKIDFEIDILSSKVDFLDYSFDVIVLSHCSWYFQSAEQFQSVLKKAKRWGKKLCFAEWDARITSMEQYPHFLAVLIQAQYESFKEMSISNVRTLFTPDLIKEIAENAGWHVVTEDSLYSPQLQDGRWEVSYTLNNCRVELEHIRNLPSKLITLIQSEINLLNEAKRKNDIKAMSTFALVAQ